MYNLFIGLFILFEHMRWLCVNYLLAYIFYLFEHMSKLCVIYLLVCFIYFITCVC